MSVPKFDGTICSTSSTGQQVGLEGAPGQSFDGSLVRGQAVRGSICVRLPDHEHVVVTTRCQLRAIWRPLQSANFLLMAAQAIGDVIPHPHIMVQDGAISAAGAEGVIVPGESRDASSVARKIPYRSNSFSIPNLSIAVGKAHGDMFPVGCPTHAGDVVIVINGEELLDVSAGRVPEVDGLVESDSDGVIAAPIEKIEVVIVDEVGGVEDAIWLLGNCSEFLGMARVSCIGCVEGCEVAAVAFWGSRGFLLEG